jgi:hypothetical protein
MAKNDETAEDTKPVEPKAKAKAEPTEGMIEMRKESERVHVHPTTVEAHKAAGWALV